MTKIQKQIILNRIAELSNQNLTIVEADSMLTYTLIKAMPKDIQQVYDKMISDMIPF
jgi:hypothetical protein